MLAIDTNLIVRFLVKDHPARSVKAKTLIESENVFVSSTVVLETAWVLRGVYGYSNDQLGAALAAFGGLPRVTLEEPAVVAQALGWMKGGVDFTDALHLAKSHGCKGFVSFDRKFAKAANLVSDIKVRVP
jgi:predicted nucleic acid-binding protein